LVYFWVIWYIFGSYIWYIFGSYGIFLGH
jgi:hypothetical protein